jgi:hypothetical protein
MVAGYQTLVHEDANKMANLFSRVTGQVLGTKALSGTKDGKEWTMNFATVLVGSHGTSEIKLPNADKIGSTIGQAPKKGDYVDWAVESYAGAKGLNTNIIGLFEELA